MSTATRLGAAFGAGVLGVMLLGNPVMAGPEGDTKDNGSEPTETDAAPGAADRDVESGQSYDEDDGRYQGTSESNPDGGGVDKPYEADGQDAETQGDTDFDGNNGCGNDSDFADDNNGNCGGARQDGGDRGDGQAGDDQPSNGADDVGEDADAAGNDVSATTGGDDDEGDAAAVGTAGDESARTDGAEVMGIQIERDAPAAAAGAEVLGAELSAAGLARTGLPLGLLALVAMALIGFGTAMRIRSRRV